MTFLAIQLRGRVRRGGDKHSCTRVSVCVLEDMEDKSSTERDSDTEVYMDALGA